MPGPLYIVELNDQRDPRLAGHTGCTYTSPPQPVDQALALVRALLGYPVDTIDAAQQPCRTPVAGGQRIIRLHVADADADGQLTIDAS
jgi:hypothetical protein